MGVTFDQNGNMMKVKRLDPSRFNNIEVAKDIIEA